MVKTGLTKEEIIHLAKLASLTLTEEEQRIYQKQLTETLEYIKNLNELDTIGVPPTNHIVNLTNIYFKDGEKNRRPLKITEALQNATHKKNNYFVVKRIL